MKEDQVRYVPRPNRSFREPSLAERLEIIRGQIKVNDQKPTDPNWEMRDTALRRRESALMVEIERGKTK